MAKHAVEQAYEIYEVKIPLDHTALNGTLTVPAQAHGLIAFAHGSGSSRFSPRNNYVANVLHERGLATLLLDLLTDEEETVDQYNRRLRFNIGLLSTRMTTTVDWLSDQPTLSELPVGLFGASTGAAAALYTAAARPRRIFAVVSRGGRPDLAPDALSQISCPTLLIVGGKDHAVIGMNGRAAAQMTTEHEISIVEGASHLFEEPGKLEQVAKLACDWFVNHLPEHTH